MVEPWVGVNGAVVGLSVGVKLGTLVVVAVGSVVGLAVAVVRGIISILIDGTTCRRILFVGVAVGVGGIVGLTKISSGSYHGAAPT